MPPGEVRKRLADHGQVRPGRGDPAAVGAVVVADPDVGEVVGVVVDLPQAPLGVQAGVLAPVGVEVGAVVGAVVDLDAVVVDLPPLDRQQFQVVVAGKADRQVAGAGDQHRVGLVGRQDPAGQVGVAQPLVRAGLPAGHEPFVQQVLQLGDGPGRLDVGATAGDVPADVAAKVLAEQRVDAFEGAFHHALVGGGPGPGGLHRDAQCLAGPQEHLREEDAAAVDGDRLGHDHRLGRSLLQAGVEAEQPLVGQAGVRHRQRLGPAGPHRFGHQDAGQQQRGVHRLGGHRAQQRRADRSRGHVHRDRQLHPAGHPVVVDGQDVQRAGVDLDLLTRAGGDGRAERRGRPVRHRAAGGGLPEGVPPRRQRRHQAVERRPGRHRHRAWPVPGGQRLLDPMVQPGPGPSRLVGLGLKVRGENRDQPRVGAAVGLRLPDGALVDQPPQALLPVAPPQPADRLDAGRVPGRGQFGRLGGLPLGEAAPARVVVRPWRRLRHRSGWLAGLDLQDVLLQQPRTLQDWPGHGVQQPKRRHPWRRGCLQQLGPWGGQQVGEQHDSRLAGLADQPDRRARQASHGVDRAVEPHPVANVQRPALRLGVKLRRRQLHHPHHRLLPGWISDRSPSRTVSSVCRWSCHSRWNSTGRIPIGSPT